MIHGGEFYKTFTNLVRDQFEYGGKKYALQEKRESTDELFDSFGKNWLLGTMCKYVYRTKNVNRGRDILKLACYCYIIWLKRGFQIIPTGINDPVLDTNVAQKSQYYDSFLSSSNEKDANASLAILRERAVSPLDLIEAKLKMMSKIEFNKITQFDLMHIFVLCYSYWFENFKDETRQDTDTWHKDDKEKK